MRPSHIPRQAAGLTQTQAAKSVVRRPPCQSRQFSTGQIPGIVTSSKQCSVHKIWQDVYRPNTRMGRVYLKLTVIQDLLIVSFKEL